MSPLCYVHIINSYFILMNHVHKGQIMETNKRVDNYIKILLDQRYIHYISKRK